MDKINKEMPFSRGMKFWGLEEEDLVVEKIFTRRERKHEKVMKLVMSSPGYWPGHSSSSWEGDYDISYRVIFRGKEIPGDFDVQGNLLLYSGKRITKDELEKLL